MICLIAINFTTYDNFDAFLIKLSGGLRSACEVIPHANTELHSCINSIQPLQSH